MLLYSEVFAGAKTLGLDAGIITLITVVGKELTEQLKQAKSFPQTNITWAGCPCVFNGHWPPKKISFLGGQENQFGQF